MTIRRPFLVAAALLALGAGCGPAPSEPALARPAAASRDGDPPPPPPDSTTTTQPPADTTGRGGGGTLGSGT